MVTPAAREWLALTGYDPAYGARPLRRLVQRQIGDRLAKALLAGEIHDGDGVLVDTVGKFGETGFQKSDRPDGGPSGLLVRRMEPGEIVEDAW